MSAQAIENATPSSEWLLALINGLSDNQTTFTLTLVTTASLALPAATGSLSALMVKNQSGSTASLVPNGGDTIDGLGGSQNSFGAHSFRDQSALMLFDAAAGQWLIVGSYFT